MISKNKIRLLTGVIKFLMDHADLSVNELRISHYLMPRTGIQCVNEYEAITKIQLVSKAGFFKKEVWSLVWNQSFNEKVELPDNLCTQQVQIKLLFKAKLLEIKNAKQNSQAALFHDNSSS